MISRQVLRSSSSQPETAHCGRCSESVASPFILGTVETPVCLGCMTQDELGQLGRDLEKAMTFDRQFLRGPPRVEGWEFAVHRKAARFLSGDIVDFRDGADQFSVVVGDVMGKGLAAAMVRVVLQSGLRMSAASASGAREITLAARVLLESAHDPVGLVSMFSVDVVRETGQLSYVNAGHPPPLLVRSADSETRLLDATAPILGLGSAVASSPLETRNVTMAPGDILAAYSDGVTEAESGDGELYDRDRLSRILLANNHAGIGLTELCERIVEDVERFGDPSNADDRTLVLVRRGANHGS